MTEPEAIGLELLNIRGTEKSLRQLNEQIAGMHSSGREFEFTTILTQWGTLQNQFGAYKCALQRHGFTYIGDGMVTSTMDVLNHLTAIQAKVLALMGWVDGRFDDTEAEYFQKIISASPGDDELKVELSKLMEVAPEKEDVLQAVAIARPEIAAAAIKNAFVLANKDGDLHDTEMALLRELGQAAGVRTDRFEDFFRMLNSHLSAIVIERDLFGT